MDIKNLQAIMRGITTYRDILTQPIMRQALCLINCVTREDGLGGLDAYTELFYLLRSAGYSGLGQWLKDALRWSESPYPQLVEREGQDPILERAAQADISAFALLANVTCEKWVAALGQHLGNAYQTVVSGLPRWRSEVPFSFESLTESYRKDGVGLFAKYRAFVWERGALIPVVHPDCPDSNQLLGYESQRAEVEQNTRALVEGRYVNNVLLYGESGTGKSATVKNLLTLPGLEELRLIEADKADLGGLPALIRKLEGKRQKFIIFIDDLTFDRDDSTYSVLKTILEGGVERRPQNVAIYATSNRRHLIRQTISERAGDEMDRTETIREKTSLADRFGVRVLFQGLSKKEFLELVDMLAEQHGIVLSSEELHHQAIAWERFHSGQTPRIALQFVRSLQPHTAEE